MQTQAVDAEIIEDELMGPVIALHAAYKRRRQELEEADKARKLERADKPASNEQPASNADAAVSVDITAAATDIADQPAAERKPRVMLIEGATDDECRQITALCTSLGIRGVFKGPRFYETVKTWMP